MNRFGFLLLVALTFAQETSGFAQGPSAPQSAWKVWWTDSIPTALKQQQETGRPLIVYVTADYCRYCRQMDRDTWSNPGVAQRVQNAFVALKLDAEQNEDLVARLGVEGLPATLIFNRKGERVQTISGYSRPAAVIELLESVSTSRTSAELDSRER